ncbi:MAG: hypothetical protein ACK2U9_17290, partial [Anaerolineae bacterium]
QGGTWSQIPFQVDEVDASGAYVSNEDGLLDGNDEVVFMAKDLGGQTTGAPSSSGGQPLASIWYTIEVSDPLVAGAKGWAYVLASA